MNWAVINILVLSLILGSHLLVSGYAVIKEDQNGFKDLAEVETNKSSRMKKTYKETAADEALYDEDGNIILVNDALYDYNDYFNEEVSEIEENPLTPVTYELQLNFTMLNELAALISSEGKEGCAVEGSMKEKGESWMDNCNTCTCMKGQPVCTMRECPQFIGSAAVITEAPPVGAAASAISAAVAVGPTMDSAVGVAEPAVATVPVMTEASAVAATPGVAVAAPAVATSPALAALAQAVAAYFFEGSAAAPVVVATPNVAEAAPVSAVVASPAVAIAPVMTALAPEVAAAPAAVPSPNLTALAPKVGAETPAVAPSPVLATLAPVVAAAASALSTSPALAAMASVVAAAALPITITPESNISVEMTSSTSESTIQTPCLEWGVNKITQEECKLPWAMIGGDCLFLSSNQNASNFIDSQNSCKKIHADADLAIPTDFNLIKEYLLKKGSFLVNKNLWVGGADSCTPGEPRWLNGSAINNNVWLSSKPTLNNKGNACVVLDINNTKLLTKTCTEKYKFICQKSVLKTTNSKPTLQKPCYNWGVNKTNPDECKLPWAMIGSDCLLLSSNHNVSTLNDSREFCKKIHAEADLAIPTDFKLINDYLQKKRSPLVNHILWIGGSDSCTPGEPRWLNGSAINNNLWQNGKPTSNNNNNGKPTSNNINNGIECVAVDVKNNNLLTKTCTEQYKFICQKSIKIIK